MPAGFETGAIVVWLPTRINTTGPTDDGAPAMQLGGVLLAVLIAVALWANRFWPIWIASLQLFALLVHIAKAYQQDVLPIVYFAVISRIAYPMLAMLVIGTACHFQRMRRYGADPDWSDRVI